MKFREGVIRILKWRHRIPIFKDQITDFRYRRECSIGLHVVGVLDDRWRRGLLRFFCLKMQFLTPNSDFKISDLSTVQSERHAVGSRSAEADESDRNSFRRFARRTHGIDACFSGRYLGLCGLGGLRVRHLERWRRRVGLVRRGVTLLAWKFGASLRKIFKFIFII